MRVGTKVKGLYLGVAFVGVVSMCRAEGSACEHVVTLFEPVNVMGSPRSTLTVYTMPDGSPIQDGSGDGLLEPVVTARAFSVV